MKSTQNTPPAEAAITFSQIEDATTILREYGAAAIDDYEGGIPVYEIDYIRRLVAVLGGDA